MSFFFFFSLFHQRADDEALTRFLQTSLFLVASPILVKSMFLSFRSSLTLSIQVFLCLPLLLVSLCFYACHYMLINCIFLTKWAEQWNLRVAYEKCKCSVSNY